MPPTASSPATRPLADPPSSVGHPADRYVAMVLLVDDQVMVAEAVRRALAGDPDIEFHFCADASRALSVAEQISPTVILQDLVMPGVDGLSLVKAYRAHPTTHQIPVIVLSSQEDPRTKSEAFAVGANDYLVKLPEHLELIARVRYHTRAHVNQLQRDEAYRALRESQRALTQANLELQRLMNLDGLTGLNNRRRFDEYLHGEWRRAIREQSPLSLLLVDVDHFKGYNDRHGHLRGDEALKHVAEAIQSSCRRPADLAARFGGEEFAVILPDTPSEGAGELAERIRKAVCQIELGLSTHLTVSIGVVTITPQTEFSPLDFISRADQALYEAKRQGRNRTVVA